MDTLTRMRALIAVVDAGGYSAAARRIGRSKALLSKHVRELEDEVGALLLNRTTRRLSLTSAGEIYVTRAREMIEQVDGLADMVRDHASAAGGIVRLTAPRALSDAKLGEVFVAFAEANPEIKLEIDLSDGFLDLVEEGFDLAIRVSRLDDSDLIAKKLAPVRLIVIASPGFLERHGEPEAPEALRSLPVILDTNRQNPHQLRFRNAAGEAMSLPIERGQLTVNSPNLALRAACAGLGFAVMPDFVCERALAEGQVREVLREFASDEMGVYAIYPHKRHLPQRVRLFLDFLSKWFRARQDGG